jgi:hypothetical protein
MYAILAVAGWLWTAIFGTYLCIRLMRHRNQTPKDAKEG